MNLSLAARHRRLIVGNWKMNGNCSSYQSLLEELVQTDMRGDEVDIVICPPFTHLYQVSDYIGSTKFMLGAQNVSEEDQGAYTGEISSLMLKDFSCKFVIIGHNERRRLQGETEVKVLDKFKACLRNQLTPILCIGESLEDRESGRHLDVIKRQLMSVVSQVGLRSMIDAVIAYEPVWAVGTGKTASPDEANEVHQFIRSCLGDVAEHVRILYGGSVKASNASELFALPDIDGALLGGASLDAKEFLTICKIANNFLQLRT